MVLWSVETLKADGEQNLKIANVMSTAATRGNPNESVYCATKWGEKGYTKSLQAAYKGTSVKIVGVYPGGIDTPFYRDSHDYVSEEKQHTFMRADQLAEVILFNSGQQSESDRHRYRKSTAIRREYNGYEGLKERKQKVLGIGYSYQVCATCVIFDMKGHCARYRF